MSSMLEIDHASAREWLHILCTKHHKTMSRGARLSRGRARLKLGYARRPSRKVSIACVPVRMNIPSGRPALPFSDPEGVDGNIHTVRG